MPSLRSGDQASTGIESIPPLWMCVPLMLSAFVRSRRELFAGRWRERDPPTR